MLGEREREEGSEEGGARSCERVTVREEVVREGEVVWGGSLRFEEDVSGNVPGSGSSGAERILGDGADEGSAGGGRGAGVARELGGGPEVLANWPFFLRGTSGWDFGGMQPKSCLFLFLCFIERRR